MRGKKQIDSQDNSCFYIDDLSEPSVTWIRE